MKQKLQTRRRASVANFENYGLHPKHFIALNECRQRFAMIFAVRDLVNLMYVRWIHALIKLGLNAVLATPNLGIK